MRTIVPPNARLIPNDAEKVFAGKTSVKIEPDQNDVESFNKFMEHYSAGLKIEKAAVENFKC